MGRAVVLIAVSAVLVSFAWLELEDPAAAWGDVGKILGLAVLPAILTAITRRWWIGVIALLVCALPAASIAFEVPVTDMRRGERDFFGPVFTQIGNGFQDLWETDAPFRPDRHLELAGLMLLSIYLLVGSIALLVTRARLLAAGIVLLVGVGVPVTISASYSIGSPLRTGALMLAALLFLLYVTATSRGPLRGLAPALVLGLVVVLAAVGASTSSAVSKGAFLSWKRWDLYDRPKDPVGVRYVWSSNYQGITFPKKETIVLRVKAQKDAVYWRATTLDEYTGVGWRERVDLAPATQSAEIDEALQDPTLPAAARQARNWTRQQVTVVALSDTHLVAAAAPIRWRAQSQGILQYASNGVVVAPGGLRLGQGYTVWSYTPEVKPDELAEVEPDYPAEIADSFEVVPDVAFPAFGTRGRDEAVEQLFAQRADDALLAEYEPLYRKAKEVVGKAKSPYIAAATLETWLRNQGGFVYEEKPEQPVDATPPLVDFALRTKEGYCQQFAGTMAVMLRLLGIPARVAVGFTSGEYDDRRNEWVVTDHAAHAWVEVYFPGYGWLSFDPTPGRGNLGGAYSTSSRDFPQGGPTALGVAPEALSAILRQRLAAGRGSEGLADELTGAVPGEEGGGGIGIAGLVFILLGGILVLLFVAKALRRRLRFVSRDPRKVASACRRDLIAFLLDQRIGFPESATLDELGAYLERHYNVNATPFVRSVNEARFGAPQRASGAAVRARRELKELERQLRRRLSASARARGALSLRSLTV